MTSYCSVRGRVLLAWAFSLKRCSDLRVLFFLEGSERFISLQLPAFYIIAGEDDDVVETNEL